MKKHLLLACITSLSLALNASDQPLKEVFMRQEILTRANPNISEQTHPVLYGLVKELCEKAQIAMPRYISLYDGEYVWVDEHGFTHQGMHTIGASVDLLGDLHICKKIIFDLPYDSVKGIVATAIAEKALNTLPKTVATGLGTAGAALLLGAAYGTNATIYSVEYDRNAAVKNELDAITLPVEYRLGGRHLKISHHSTLGVTTVLSIITGLVAAKVYNNTAQKNVDLYALKLTDAQNVINGIHGASTTTDAYVKENIFSRLTPQSLKKLYRVLSYPIRSYTPEERVAYLEKAVANKAHGTPVKVIS